ncbi:hypothetical protein BC629DRAFT_1446662 [Irpex lacteus]|nr:hypothetical protein BC629DRAFT_1446662 [Irpex lacteus]
MDAQQHSTAQHPPQLSSTKPSHSDAGSGSPPIDHVTAQAQVVCPAQEQEGKDVDVVEPSHAATHLHPNTVAPRRNDPIYRTPAFSDLGEYNLADWARDRIDRHHAQIRDEKMRAQMEAQREEERLRKEKEKAGLDVQDGRDAGSSGGQGSGKESNDSKLQEVDSSSASEAPNFIALADLEIPPAAVRQTLSLVRPTTTAYDPSLLLRYHGLSRDLQT